MKIQNTFSFFTLISLLVFLVSFPIFAATKGIAKKHEKTPSAFDREMMAMLSSRYVYDHDDQELENTCSMSVFNKSASWSDAMNRILAVKHETGYLPDNLFNFIVRDANEEYFERILNGLKKLSVGVETKAIIYGQLGESTCLWLVSKNGILAQAKLNSDAIDAPKLLNIELDVETISRARLEPRKRNGDEDCTSSNLSTRADDKINNSNVALLNTSKILLSNDIIEVLKAGEGLQRLIVVPTRDLRAIPFAALPLGQDGVSLIDKFALIIVPEITTILSANAHIDDKQTNKNKHQVLVVGNPDLSKYTDVCFPSLSHAELEASHTAKRFDSSSLLIGKNATYSKVLEKLKKEKNNLDLIFFATHGVSDDINPADKSYLALTGKHLRGSDISKLHFGSKPIVVMSACQTGLGKTFTSGMFGLVEAWRFSGASAVVASLWDVSDEGTALLMEHFVDNLNQRNLSGAEFALTDAMRFVKRQNPDPVIWAAFSVIGTPSD